MRIQLSDHFTYNRLYRFVFPTVVMMLFTSIYGIVDGLFVSNFAGRLPFAAVNLIFPFIMILGAVGFMFGTGGTAVVSKKLGELDKEGANKVFSLLVYVTIIVGLVLAVLGIIFTPAIAKWLISSEKEMSDVERAETLEYCIVYGRIILAAIPAFMLQNVFQGFFVTAEKPRLGLFVVIVAGLTNIVLDGLFIAVFGWGIVGAAVATALSQVVGGVVPLFYFGRKNDSLLRLGKTKYDGRVLLRVCFNGSSELLSNISASFVTILYNAQLMKFAGVDGVSAYGVIMYVSFIFAAIFIGYSIGAAPIVGYNYGAQNHGEMKNVFKKSLYSVFGGGIVMLVLAFVLAAPLSNVFVGYDQDLCALTVKGLKIYSFSFLVCGLNIFSSSFFTALGNGLISALISTSRFIFQMLTVLVLPLIFQLDGVWYAIMMAEILAAILAVVLLAVYRKKYQYV